MHIIGLLHEHMRYDRDNFITVHLENVDDEDHYGQFDKVPQRQAWTYNVSYDYTSIMHYKKNAFSKDYRITIETHNAAYQVRIYS
ncbi:astacin [Oesophagostomum dentatum]|uniref:Metalloendopeptidase n=1 Tax=Oesophagostomum dentatum TaxID=61180 RepID=A0A0B1S0E2_OESDE|nr:astacin [Oesophagostomum dentatum]